MIGSWTNKLALLIAFGQMAAAAAGQPMERPQLPGIKGDDDRRLIRTTDYPWRAIGRVNMRTGGFCSGTMIAPGQVLTAAHCLWNTKTRDWIPAKSLHFVAGYKQGGYVAHSRVASYRRARTFVYGRKLSADQTSRDWAILTLSRDISSVTGVIPLVSAGGRDDVARGRLTVRLIQAGYSQDKAHMLSVHRGCHIRRTDRQRRLIYHDCDAVKGDSGSPLLIRTGERYHLLAIHVATRAEPGRPTEGVAAMGYDPRDLN